MIRRILRVITTRILIVKLTAFTTHRTFFRQLDIVGQTGHVFAAPQQPWPFPIFSLLPQHLSNLVRVSSKLMMPQDQARCQNSYPTFSQHQPLYISSAAYKAWFCTKFKITGGYVRKYLVRTFFLFNPICKLIVSDHSKEIPDPSSDADSRVVPDDQRKRITVRACQWCRSINCPGNSDISSCKIECKVACKNCGRFTGCRGRERRRQWENVVAKNYLVIL